MFWLFVRSFYTSYTWCPSSRNPSYWVLRILKDGLMKGSYACFIAGCVLHLNIRYDDYQ